MSVRKNYDIKSSGVNSQGNHWDARYYGPSAPNQNAYHYSNQNGSYYYSNPDGSRYYSNVQGEGRYHPPSVDDQPPPTPTSASTRTSFSESEISSFASSDDGEDWRGRPTSPKNLTESPRAGTGHRSHSDELGGDHHDTLNSRSISDETYHTPTMTSSSGRKLARSPSAGRDYHHQPQAQHTSHIHGGREQFYTPAIQPDRTLASEPRHGSSHTRVLSDGSINSHHSMKTPTPHHSASHFHSQSDSESDSNSDSGSSTDPEVRSERWHEPGYASDSSGESAHHATDIQSRPDEEFSGSDDGASSDSSEGGSRHSDGELDGDEEGHSDLDGDDDDGGDDGESSSDSN